jgi:pimeloyl-ACP methyl ester carboxylesterase
MLQYTESGRGKILVLVHGFCESNVIWKNFQSQLSEKYHVICPDLPGFGKSPLKVKDIGIAYYAEMLKELLSFLDVEQCCMIGHSLGGYVTLAFAEKYPVMLNSFGLFNSTAFADSTEKKDSRNKTIQFIEKHGVEMFAQSFVAPLFYAENRTRLKEEIGLMTSIAGASSKEGVIEATKAMRDRQDRVSVLKNTSLPVLFIIGKEDTAVPIEKSLEQCYLPADSTVYFIKGVGHMGMLEAEEKTMKMIDAFLNRI